MLVDDLVRPVGQGEADVEETLHLIEDLFEHRSEMLVPARPGDGHVELGVPAHVRLDAVDVLGVVTRLLKTVEDAEVLRVLHVLRRERRRFALQKDPEREEVTCVLDGHGGDPIAGTCACLDQTLAANTRKRLAHRRLADAQLARERRLGEHRSRRKVEVDELRLDGRVRAVRQIGHGRPRFHRSVASIVGPS